MKYIKELMSNQRIDRIATRKASTTQLEELRIHAKKQYREIKLRRQLKEHKKDEKVSPTVKELEWMAEVHRLDSSITYRKNKRNVNHNNIRLIM